MFGSLVEFCVLKKFGLKSAGFYATSRSGPQNAFEQKEIFVLQLYCYFNVFNVDNVFNENNENTELRKVQYLYINNKRKVVIWDQRVGFICMHFL